MIVETEGTTEAEFVAALDRQALVGAVNDEIRLYARDGNGLHVWRAYSICRQAGAPIPEVILRCLDDFAQCLSEAKDAAEIAAALGMEVHGARSARRDVMAADRAWLVAGGVHLLMSLPHRQPLSQREACRRVGARYGLKPETVRKIYQRW